MKKRVAFGAVLDCFVEKVRLYLRKNTDFLKKTEKCIDRGVFFAYNRSMNTSAKKIAIWILRIFLTVSCVGLICFIFSNSMEKASDSAARSGDVVEMVQEVVSYVAPNSPIATATGAEYDKLHHVIRKLAHFSEFALLGTLLIWCYFSYTLRKKLLFIPCAVMLLVPTADECLQLFFEGRGAAVTDVCIDVAGCVFGGACALLVVGLTLYILHKKKEKRARTEASAEKGEA